MATPGVWNKDTQVVKVICHKTRIAAAHGRFYRIRQVAPMCTPDQYTVPWTRLSIPNCISIGSAGFARLTIVTDRPTDIDHSTPSVTIGRIYAVLRCGLIMEIKTCSTSTRSTEKHSRQKLLLSVSRNAFQISQYKQQEKYVHWHLISTITRNTFPIFCMIQFKFWCFT